MKFVNSTIEDFAEIFRLYDEAIEFQKKIFHHAWLPFDQDLIRREIEEKRHWKILFEDKIGCIFSVAFDDPLIWQEKAGEPAIYIHRIVKNHQFPQQKWVPAIVEWARGYVKSIGKDFIRMDTWGDNQKLIDYYTDCGFEFLGVVTPTKTVDLPKHYEGISLSLFEIKID